MRNRLTLFSADSGIVDVNWSGGMGATSLLGEGAEPLLDHCFNLRRG